MATRLMGDATHSHVGSLVTIKSKLQLVAGYVTGSPDVVWTAADFSEFPNIPHVTIDQGFTGSPIAWATVRDVEPGAWSAYHAVHDKPWTPDRPTIYCDRYDLSRTGGVLDSGWKGDLWLAFPGWKTGDSLPSAPGCNYVAVQNDFTNPNRDLSVVLDSTWPFKEADPVSVQIPGVPGVWLDYTSFTDYTTTPPTPYVVGTGTNGKVYLTKFTGGHWTPPVVV